MRAYFFGNYYLSSIQQGIQAAHCITDMLVKYNASTEHPMQQTKLLAWATYHKTMVLLKGGNCNDLRSIYMSIRSLSDSLELPYMGFSEDEGSLNRAMTCVGVIVPEEVYNLAALLRDFGDGVDLSNYHWDEVYLAKTLNQHSLAS